LTKSNPSKYIAFFTKIHNPPHFLSAQVNVFSARLSNLRPVDGVNTYNTCAAFLSWIVRLGHYGCGTALVGHQHAVRSHRANRFYDLCGRIQPMPETQLRIRCVDWQPGGGRTSLGRLLRGQQPLRNGSADLVVDLQLMANTPLLRHRYFPLR
jgi:hypothetical protein